MSKLKAFDNCIFELGKLPGIGRKTATRLSLHLLKMNQKDVFKIADALVELKNKTRFCSTCGGITDQEVCDICTNTNRNRSIICVVEEAKDIFLIEQLGRYNGVYHSLGGRISPVDGINPENLRIEELIKRIQDSNGEVQEVILATNPDVDGETTSIYIAKQLNKTPNIRVSRIASGIPVGSHLEYADNVTILKALEGRLRIND